MQAHKQEVHAIKGNESALLRFPHVELVQLGPDSQIDCHVLGMSMQMQQALGVLAIHLSCPLHPFTPLHLQNRRLGARILHHLKRLTLGSHTDELDESLPICLILQPPIDIETQCKLQ